MSTAQRGWQALGLPLRPPLPLCLLGVVPGDLGEDIARRAELRAILVTILLLLHVSKL